MSLTQHFYTPVPESGTITLPPEFRRAEDGRKSKTLKQIIDEQGGPKAADFDELYGAGAGLWESDEEFMEYMKILEHSRTY